MVVVSRGKGVACAFLPGDLAPHPHRLDGRERVLPASPVANTGVWSTAEVGDGGDPRSAANYFDAVEAALDRLNYLAWREIDIVDGGTWTFRDIVTSFNRALLPHVALPGHLVPLPSLPGPPTLA
jgi:hypothetical protein